MKPKQTESRVIVDDKGFVSIEGVRFSRLSPTGQSLQFLDKDRRRCEMRGTQYVEVPISELTKLVVKK